MNAPIRLSFVLLLLLASACAGRGTSVTSAPRVIRETALSLSEPPTRAPTANPVREAQRRGADRKPPWPVVHAGR